MMVVLKTMEEQGLVMRSAHERHPNVLELQITDVGREALHLARERVEPVERRIAAAFSPRDLEDLRAILIRFIEALDTE